METVVEFKGTDLDQLRPVNYDYSPVSVAEARRNIFIYYEPPPPVQKGSVVPTPTPTPVPPVLLAGLSPANVYARTGDFTLEISGDKFTSQLRVVIDNNELPTRYINPQQLSATVPAAIIANPGGHQVMLRSPDGKTYSNTTTLSVAAPPTPMVVRLLRRRLRRAEERQSLFGGHVLVKRDVAARHDAAGRLV